MSEYKYLDIRDYLAKNPKYVILGFLQLMVVCLCIGAIVLAAQARSIATSEKYAGTNIIVNAEDIYTCGDSIVFPIQHGDYCYHVSNRNLNYQESIRFCKQLNPAAHLLRIADQAHNDFMTESLTKMGKAMAWLDLHDIHEEGKWKFSDGSEPSFFNWASGEPNNMHKAEDCASLSRFHGWKWNDGNCYYSFGIAVVCQLRTKPLKGVEES